MWSVVYFAFLLYLCAKICLMIDYVSRFICTERKCSVDSVFNRDMNLKTWYTRYMIWHYLHCCKSVATSKIAKAFGRNRPSIFRGIRVFKHQMKYNKELRKEYYSIIEKIEGAVETATPPEN